MNVSYREIIKKAVAIVLMAVILVCMVTGFSYTFTAKADDTIIATGYVNYDVTSLRIRTAPVNGSVITKVDGGFKFDIYEEVNTSATYKWYSIGFYLNGEYTRGYIHQSILLGKQSQIIHQIIILKIILRHRISRLPTGKA